jgi:hypothetical protein
LIPNFEKFNGFLTQYVNQTSDADTKVRLVRVNKDIYQALAVFIQTFQRSAAQLENALIRANLIALAAKVLLAFCSLDTHPLLLRALSTARPLLAENAMRFFPSQLKDVLTPTHGRVLDSVFRAFATATRQAANIYGTNTNPAVGAQVLSCLHENDKLHTLLGIAVVALAELAPVRQVLELTDADLGDSSEAVRICLQLSAIHGTTLLIGDLAPFLDLLEAAASVQKDAVYQSFIADAMTALTARPPTGVFDAAHVLAIAQGIEALLAPAVNVVQLAPKFVQFTPNPGVLETSVQGLTSTLQTIAQLRPFLNALYRDNRLDLPAFLGYPLKQAVDNVEQSVALQSDPKAAGAAGSGLVKALYSLGDTLDTQEELKESAAKARALAAAIAGHAGLVALGGSEAIPQLVASLQEVVGLITPFKGIAEKLTQDLQEKFAAPAATVTSPGGIPLESVPIVGADGRPVSGLAIDALPGQKDLDELYMGIVSSGSDALQGLLGGYLDGLNVAVAEFLPLYEHLKKHPEDAAALARMKELAGIIAQGKAAIAQGVAFDPLTATPDHVAELLGAAAAPELVLNLAALANATLRDPARTLVAAALAEAVALLATDPIAAAGQIEAIGLSLAGDSRAVCADLVDRLRLDIREGDPIKIQRASAQLLAADRIARALAGLTPSASDPASIQARLVTATGRVERGKKLPPALSAELLQLTDEFAALLAETGDITSGVTDAELPDGVADSIAEVSRLTAALTANLKKLTPESLAAALGTLRLLRARAVDIAALALSAARPERRRHR